MPEFLRRLGKPSLPQEENGEGSGELASRLEWAEEGPPVPGPGIR